MTCLSQSCPSSARYGEAPSPAPRSSSPGPLSSDGTRAGRRFLGWIFRLSSAMRRALAMLTGRVRCGRQRIKPAKLLMPPSKLVIALPLLLTLTSCSSVEPQSPAVIVNKTYSGCKVFRPITWSPKDTRQTVAQIERYSAAREKLCK